MRSPAVTLRLRGRRVVAAAAAGLLLLAPVALAQTGPTPITPAPIAPVQSAPIQDAAPPPPQAPVAQPVEKPGLFEAIGRWIDRGGDIFHNDPRGAEEQKDTLGSDAAENTRELGSKAADIGKGAVEVTRGAVDTVARLPATRVIKGHERCTVAPNGAPDCVAAAETMCRKNGFSSGKSLDFTSAEECSARVRLSGRQSEADCTTVTFISRAVCQ